MSVVYDASRYTADSASRPKLNMCVIKTLSVVVKTIVTDVGSVCPSMSAKNDFSMWVPPGLRFNIKFGVLT